MIKNRKEESKFRESQLEARKKGCKCLRFKKHKILPRIFIIKTMKASISFLILIEILTF